MPVQVQRRTVGCDGCETDAGHGTIEGGRAFSQQLWSDQLRDEDRNDYVEHDEMSSVDHEIVMLEMLSSRPTMGANANHDRVVRAACDSVNSGSALVSRLYTQQNIAVHGAAVVALVHQYLATLAEPASSP